MRISRGLHLAGITIVTPKDDTSSTKYCCLQVQAPIPISRNPTLNYIYIILMFTGITQ